MSTLSLIAAVARNGTVGVRNRLPWHLPQDMAHFRAATLGCPVIMGRKTWDSLPERFRPLPGRHNIVVTRQQNWHASGATAVHDLPAALAAAAPAPKVFVIGGASLYAAALPLADELMLTEIDADFEGDAHFPAWPREQFAELRRDQHQASTANDFAFSFVTYQRIQH
ncbi:MAG: dihydrofolate reductase [Ideonella sp.]|nr:dihydrofolate reductase [Ideonella sp.]